MPTEVLPCSSNGDVMRENGGSVNVVVAVDGVNPIKHGYLETGGQGALLEAVHHVHPCLW